jgi:hypothetical protein
VSHPRRRNTSNEANVSSAEVPTGLFQNKNDDVSVRDATIVRCERSPHCLGMSTATGNYVIYVYAILGLHHRVTAWHSAHGGTLERPSLAQAVPEPNGVPRISLMACLILILCLFPFLCPCPLPCILLLSLCARSSSADVVHRKQEVDFSITTTRLAVLITVVYPYSALGTFLTQNGVFWDVTPCDSCKNRRFGGT